MKTPTILDRMWAILQQDLAAESPGCSHLIAHESGHNIQHDQPGLVAAAIRNLVMQARQSDRSYKGPSER